MMVTRKPPMGETSIDQAICDHRLLGAGLGDLATWQTWRVALKAAFALPLTPAERKVFTAIAGDRGLPKRRVRELWCLVGRGGGKSRMAAALGDYLALFQTHKLSPGERGHVLVLAATTDQARTVFGYSQGFLEASKVLEREVKATTATEIRLRNNITLAVHPNSFRSIRGKTLMAVVCDEVAIWRDEASATPDVEVYTAVLPSLARTGGMLIGISTPYRKLGLLYTKHRDHFGIDDDDILVVQGSALAFNSTLDVAAIAAARAADPAAAGAEWDAEFRADLAAFLDDELIDRAVDLGRPLELPPRAGIVYWAFTDASGGAVNGDAYTLAIGHREGDIFVIDAVRGHNGPFDPQEVTKEYAQLCRDYHVSRVTGDNYAKEWVVDAWRKAGFEYVPSKLVRDEIYLECLPVFTRGLVRLPDHARLVRELRLLERQTHRSGRDTVNHPRNGHDDHANVVCGVINLIERIARAASRVPNVHVMPDLSTTACGITLPGSMGDSWSPPYNW
jgi:hypothetical protein